RRLPRQGRRTAARPGRGGGAAAAARTRGGSCQAARSADRAGTRAARGGPVKASAFVYPWDVSGDPEAPARIAALGTAQVTLASAYHSTRALTPRHPRHRVVTAEHAAVLYPAGEDRWSGR